MKSSMQRPLGRLETTSGRTPSSPDRLPPLSPSRSLPSLRSPKNSNVASLARVESEAELLDQSRHWQRTRTSPAEKIASLAVQADLVANSAIAASKRCPVLAVSRWENTETASSVVNICCNLTAFKQELKGKRAFLVAYNAEGVRGPHSSDSAHNDSVFNPIRVVEHWKAAQALSADMVPLRCLLEEVPLSLSELRSAGATSALLRIVVIEDARDLTDWSVVGDSLLVRLPADSTGITSPKLPKDDIEQAQPRVDQLQRELRSVRQKSKKELEEARLVAAHLQGELAAAKARLSQELVTARRRVAQLQSTLDASDDECRRGLETALQESQQLRSELGAIKQVSCTEVGVMKPVMQGVRSESSLAADQSSRDLADHNRLVERLRGELQVSSECSDAERKRADGLQVELTAVQRRLSEQVAEQDRLAEEVERSAQLLETEREAALDNLQSLIKTEDAHFMADEARQSAEDEAKKFRVRYEQLQGRAQELWRDVERRKASESSVEIALKTKVKELERSVHCLEHELEVAKSESRASSHELVLQQVLEVAKSDSHASSHGLVLQQVLEVAKSESHASSHELFTATLVDEQ